MATTSSKNRVLDLFEAILIYLFAALLVLILVGCGGGGDSPPANAPPSGPAIAGFSADRTTYFVGDRPTVTAIFSGGTGRVVNLTNPQVSTPIVSGQPLALSALAESGVVRLIVETNDASVNRDLTLPITLRGRYLAAQDRLGASGHAAIALPDGSAIITGGSRGESTSSFAIDRFDAVTNRLTRVGNLVNGREGHRMALLNDGNVLVVGGLVSLSGASNAELVQRSDWTSIRLSPMSTPRIEHTATTLTDGRVLVTGGRTAEGFANGISPTAELYDPATRTFRRLATLMTSPRAGHTAVNLSDGRVLILGGYGAAASFAEIFNPLNETFTSVASPVTTDRANLVAERLRDGTVLIAGGESSESTLSDQVLRYHPAANTITVATMRLPQPTSFAQSALLPDGRMGMFGGVAVNQFIGLTRAFVVGSTASDATVASLTAIPDGRVLHTVTRLADGRTLIVGGAVGLGFASTVYLFD